MLLWYLSIFTLSLVFQDIKSQSVQQANKQKHRRLYKPEPVGYDKRCLTQVCLCQEDKILNIVITMKM